jgi:1-acyl-sn-glycerol-3-phosphate acyltransferase
MKPFYRLTRFIFKAYFHIFYRHEVYGVSHILPGKAIIAPNHTSFLDPPLIAISSPEEVFFLARKSLFSPPFFRSIISQLNAFPVTGTAQDLGSIKLICRLLNDNKKIVIFPEGVRSSNGNLTPIKSGIGMLALRCKAPIIPVYIRGCYEIWNRTQRFPKLWGKTTCVFGSPIDSLQYSNLEKKQAQEALATHVKDSIEALKQWYENGAQGETP